MSEYYRSINARMPDDRGASSFVQTQRLRDDMLKLFEQYNIKSLFDAGCNDCTWAHALAPYINYQGGDISPSMIAEAWHWYPNLKIDIFDITTDPIPTVDCVLMRDVAIHLVITDQKLAIQNWLRSGVSWILMTHVEDAQVNNNGIYGDNLYHNLVNWCIDPWNFPEPKEKIVEVGDGVMASKPGRRLALWHRDDIVNLL